jgi:hypothetical protein
LDESSDTIKIGALTASTSGAKGVAVNGTFTVTVASAPMKQTVNDWQTDAPECGGVPITKTLTVSATMPIEYTFTIQTDGDAVLTGVKFVS